MIAAGHPPEAIKRYTRRQLSLYYETACRRELKERADRLEELALARGSGKEIRAAMKRWRSPPRKR